MIARYDRTVFERVKVFFARYTVDHHDIFFDQIGKVRVSNRVGYPAFYFTGYFFAKVIHLVGRKFGRGGIVLYGDVEITRALVFLNPS
jgi:hypothetical protein